MALKKLNSIGRVPKSVGEGLREGIKNFIDHIQAKVVAGRKQNDQVYHDRIPDLETLEPYPGEIRNTFLGGGEGGTSSSLPPKIKPLIL